jgi:hypothetical protein
LLLGALLACAARAAHAQESRERNVILVVVDGLRRQEVFTGADSTLLSGDDRDAFWRSTPDERRRALMPFLWDSVAQRGTIYRARAANGYNVSYPGYNEMLTGRVDPRIRDNKAGRNANETIFDWIAARPAFRGRVAAFGTWSTFNDIFNRDRASYPVRAGWDIAPGVRTHRWRDVADDTLLQPLVLRALRDAKPRLLFAGYGDTDEWAHDGRYDRVLRSARAADSLVAELWAAAQSTPQYRGTTTLIVAADHGRGATRRDWREHRQDIAGASESWIAIMGPGIPARGVSDESVTLGQIAATVARALGEDYTAAVTGVAPPMTPPQASPARTPRN